jgi:hypothetical protein
VLNFTCFIQATDEFELREYDVQPSVEGEEKKGEYSMYPQWDSKLADHNGGLGHMFLRRLTEQVKAKGSEVVFVN